MEQERPKTLVVPEDYEEESEPFIIIVGDGGPGRWINLGGGYGGYAYPIARWDD